MRNRIAYGWTIGESRANFRAQKFGRRYITNLVHVTKCAESVRGIAERHLDDADRWPEIARANADQFSDLQADDDFPPKTEVFIPKE